MGKVQAIATKLANTSNDAEETIALGQPWIARVEIEGTCPILFHRWSCEAIAEKSAAKKGSAAKKSDNIESYVYRGENGNLGIPGVYLVSSITDPRNGAAKYLQDPRSPRKSALDLFRAGIVSLTEVADLGKATWDFLDQRRVMVQRNGITRVRPAMLKGWKATFLLQTILPEYISSSDLNAVLVNAGRLVGIGDYRPTYGRFQVNSFEIFD